jgi:hypothetical protein
LKPSNDQRPPGSQSARERKSRLHFLGETPSLRFSGLPFRKRRAAPSTSQVVNSEPGQRDWTPCARQLPSDCQSVRRSMAGAGLSFGGCCGPEANPPVVRCSRGGLQPCATPSNPRTRHRVCCWGSRFWVMGTAAPPARSQPAPCRVPLVLRVGGVLPSPGEC